LTTNNRQTEKRKDKVLQLIWITVGTVTIPFCWVTARLLLLLQPPLPLPLPSHGLRKQQQRKDDGPVRMSTDICFHMPCCWLSCA
jgi:hypothetical protein